MRPGRNFLLLACLCASAALAGAQAGKPLSALPAGSFQFQGVWDCAGAFGNGKVHRSTYTGRVILDGKWLQLTEQDLEPATGYQAEYLIGYDADQKRLVEFDANNFSAAIYASAEGWQNGVLTMTSDVSHDARAPYAANRFVFTIAAPDAFTVDWQIQNSAASPWAPADHLACRRNTHA